MIIIRLSRKILKEMLDYTSNIPRDALFQFESIHKIPKTGAKLYNFYTRIMKSLLSKKFKILHDSPTVCSTVMKYFRHTDYMGQISLTGKIKNVNKWDSGSHGRRISKSKKFM